VSSIPTITTSFSTHTLCTTCIYYVVLSQLTSCDLRPFTLIAKHTIFVWQLGYVLSAETSAQKPLERARSPGRPTRPNEMHFWHWANLKWHEDETYAGLRVRY
jgi:hypothetical protein